MPLQYVFNSDFKVFVPETWHAVAERLSGGAPLQASLAVKALRRGLQQLALLDRRRFLLLLRLLRLFLPLKKEKGTENEKRNDVRR